METSIRPLLLLTIDTEEEWDWHAGWPTTGFTVRNIARLPKFQDFCARLGLAVTYFTNYAVLQDSVARDVMLDLAKRENVEIGMHIHPWNTPPLNSNNPVTARETFLHNLPEEITRAKLASVYDSFTSCGLRPTSFRGGRYSTSPVIQQFLREKGFLADASVVPFTTWPDAGAPDYRSRDGMPMRLQGPLWEIPLSRGFTRRPFRLWQCFYQMVEYSFLSRLRCIGITEKLGLVRKVWMNFEQHSAEELLSFLRVFKKMNPPCICFTLHSSSLSAGMSPYTRTQEDEDRLYARMEKVFDSPECDGLESATVSAAAQKMEAEYHARTRHQPA